MTSFAARSKIPLWLELASTIWLSVAKCWNKTEWDSGLQDECVTLDNIIARIYSQPTVTARSAYNFS